MFIHRLLDGVIPKHAALHGLKVALCFCGNYGPEGIFGANFFFLPGMNQYSYFEIYELLTNGAAEYAAINFVPIFFMDKSSVFVM